MKSLFRTLLLAAGALAALAAPSLAQQVNPQTGTTYTVLNTDCTPDGRKLISFSNVAGVAVTLPQAGGSGQFIGCTINIVNIGLGNVTVTPTTSTVNGATALVIPAGGSATLMNDATAAVAGNYFAIGGSPSGAATQSANTFRNALDNGAMQINQRGTGIQTCGTTSGVPSTSYSADRWGCVVNVVSGAGRQVYATSSPPTGFSGYQTLYRTSGALTQTVCSIQEVPTVTATTLAGKRVTLSFYAKALAGLAADNANTIKAYILEGTGTDEGLGTFNASPALAASWTGANFAMNGQGFTINTSWVRYSASADIASTTKEVAVYMCFTPSASGAGVTDGFSFTGVQLEAGYSASPFEFRSYAQDLSAALRYYWQVTEPSASVSIGASGQGASTTTCILSIPLPATMRAAPTASFLGTALSTSTWTVTHVVTNTALATPFLAATTGGHTANVLNLTATVASGLTAGQTCTLTGAGGGGIIAASADF